MYTYAIRLGWTIIDTMQEQRKLPTFMQYAMTASREALEDASWFPKDPKEQEMTVSYHVRAQLSRLIHV